MLKKYERSIAILLIAFLAVPLNLFTSIATGLAEDGDEAKVIYYEDFKEENNALFIQSGNPGLEYVSDMDFTENGKALHLSMRANDYDAIDLKYETLELKEGYTYSIKVEGYVDEEVDIAPESQAAIVLIDKYDYRGVVDLVAGESFTLSGVFVADSELNDRVRIQSNAEGKEVPFFIGEVTIVEVSAPEVDEPELPDEPEEFEPKVIYENDFESNDTEGWFGRGDAEVSITDDGSGENSALLVTDREDGWHGPGINLTSLLESGAQYEMEVSVKRVIADEASTLTSTVAEEPEAWINVAEQTISDTDWSVLKDTYSLSHGVTYAEFYVESSDTTEDFYIDNVKITQLTPGQEPEEEEDLEEIPEDERVAIFTDFEDGTSQGWGARNDNEDLTVADIGANDSSHSLLVENRQSSSDAALIEFLDKMHPGYEYEFSLWVRLAEGEEDTPLKLSAAETVNDETSYYPPVISPTMATADDWVLLEGTYAVPRNIEALSFYVEEEYDEDSTSGVSYYIDDFKAEVLISDNPVQTDLASLKDLYDGEFLIGNAVEYHHFNGRTLELLNHHHNLVTAENVMKPENYYSNGEFTHSRQDQWLQNAVDNNMLIHGHVLLWHSQSEDSLYQNPDGSYKTPEEALANMHEHIENVMKTADDVAGDNIISWDVVNEALDGDWSNPEDWENILRPASGWLQAIGSDYMYEAFLKARQVADELGRYDMVLYYNDYNDHIQAKARTMYHMVKDINDRYAEEYPDDTRLLIGGVGMQAHYTTTVNVENVRESLERFISLGVEVGVTELDVGASEGTTLTDRENLEQAYFYAQLFNLYREHAENISRVTLWGLSDGNSWRSENSPLLFDRNLQAKTAYHAVADPEKYFAENEDPGQVIARQGNAGFGTPQIDGEIDEIWDNAPILPINRFQTAHNGATGEARVLWDNENIYVLAEVNDNELDKSNSQAHEQDSVEVFIDEQNTKSASYGEGHGQYRVNFDNEQSFNGVTGEGFESRTVVNGTNYQVEMKIPFTTTTLEAGEKIGFDVQINDAVNGNRNSVAIWSDVNSGMGWSDPSVFGEVTLLESFGEIPETPDNEVIIESGEKKEVKAGQTVVVQSQDGEETEILIPKSFPDNVIIQPKHVKVEELGEIKSESGKLLINVGQIIQVEFENLPEDYVADEDDPFEIVLSYDTNIKWVAIYYYNSETEEWERKGGDVDPDAGTITFNPLHFSTYGAFEIPLEDVIADLEQDIIDLNISAERLAELEQEITDLKAELQDALGATEEQSLRDLITELLARLEALEERVAELEGGGEETPGTGEETPGDRDTMPGTGDETDEEPVLNGDSEDESDGESDAPTEDSDGDKLPSTATSLFNYMLIGALVLLVGAGLALYSYKRKRA